MSGEGKEPGGILSSIFQQDKDKEKPKEVSCWAKFRPWEDWRGEYGFDWVREGKDDYKEENSVGSSSPYDDLVDEDKPFEYLLNPGFIEKATYEKNVSSNDGAWYYNYEIIGKDMWNGDKSVNDRIYSGVAKEKYKMYHYVKLREKNCSLLGTIDHLQFPIYDVEIKSANRENKKGVNDKEVSFKYNGASFKFEYSYDSFSPFDSLKISPVPIRVEITVSRNEDVNQTVVDSNALTQGKSAKGGKKGKGKGKSKQPETNIRSITKTLQYAFDFIEDKVGLLDTYQNKALTAEERHKINAVGMEEKDEDGNYVMEKNPLRTDPNQFWEECTNHDADGVFDKLLHYKDVDIAHLAACEKLEEIKIVVSGPTSLIMFTLTDKEGLVKKDDKITWYNHEVRSWKELLGESFQTMNIELKDKDGNIVKDEDTQTPKKYYIPVLSVGGFREETNIFGFRWGDKWTPHTKAFDPVNGIPIQVNLEGEIPDEVNYEVKLTAKNNGSLGKFLTFFTGKNLEIVTSDINPDNVLTVEAGKPKKEYTIKLFPQLNKNAFYEAHAKMQQRTQDPVDKIDKCQARVIAKGKYKDGREEEIGELQVNLLKIQIATVWFVYVKIPGFWNRFSSSHKKAIEEQKKALQNGFYQAGIKLNYMEGEISMEEGEVKDEEVPDQATRDLIFEKFKEKYDKENKEGKVIKGNRFHYVIFFFPTAFFSGDDGTVAFTKMGDTKTFVSNYIVKNRRYAYTVAHEIGHDLGLPHIFQISNPRYSNDFCFGKGETSNIMDYDIYNGITYSFRKFQWDRMRMVLDAHNKSVKEKLLNQ